MRLHKQDEEELRELRHSFDYWGRILEMREVRRKSGKPFWLFLVHRFEETIPDPEHSTPGNEKRKAVYKGISLVSWRKVRYAEEGRKMFFDLIGNQWRGHEEIGNCAIDWTTKWKPPADLAKRTGLSEAIVKKAQTGIISEDGFNFMASGLGLSTKAKWIVDCMVDRIAKDPVISPLLQPEKFRFSLAEIKAVMRDPGVLQGFGFYDFTDDDIRDATGQELHGSEIRALIEEVKEASLQGALQYFYENGEWKKLEIFSRLIADLATESCGVAKHGKGGEGDIMKSRYLFHPGTISFVIFLSNVAYGKFGVYPKEFYAMSPGSQELWRHYVSHRKQGQRFWFHREAWLDLLEMPNDRPGRRVKQAEPHFAEIKKAMGKEFKKIGKSAKKTEFIESATGMQISTGKKKSLMVKNGSSMV